MAKIRMKFSYVLDLRRDGRSTSALATVVQRKKRTDWITLEVPDRFIEIWRLLKGPYLLDVSLKGEKNFRLSEIRRSRHEIIG